MAQSNEKVFAKTLEHLREHGVFLQKIGEMETTCPACGSKGLVIEDYLYDMPEVGKVILSTGKCRVCGYRYTDVRIAEAKEPRRIIFRVEEPEDLNSLVIRASTATIRIPEIGAEMKPGPAAQGFITTVEGVLHMFKDVLEFLCQEKKDKVCIAKLEWFKRAIDGGEKFTLIIEDPEGVSMVKGKKREPVIESL